MAAAASRATTAAGINEVASEVQLWHMEAAQAARQQGPPSVKEVPAFFLLPEPALAPLCQVRCCLGGLLGLMALRCAAVKTYVIPGGLTWTGHLLSCAADMVALLGSIPVANLSTLGACVHHRCLGSLLTLLLTAGLCDAGAASIFLGTAGASFRLTDPLAKDEGAPVGVAFIDVWECILLSSLALELALCFSVWQFYRACRQAGVYPPNAAQLQLREVSALEIICEAEDVALLSDQCDALRSPSADMEFRIHEHRAQNVGPYSLEHEDTELLPVIYFELEALR